MATPNGPSRNGADRGNAEGFNIPIESDDAPQANGQPSADEKPSSDAQQAPQNVAGDKPAAGAVPDAPAQDASDAKPAGDQKDAGGADDTDVVAEAEAVIDSAELDKAKKEASDWQDRYLRLHAEWDTYRRRTNEERAEEKARASEKLVKNLLPVIDDFERTIDYAEKNGEGDLLNGVKAVHTKLLDVLQKDGVEVLDPAGEAYDALEAQAVATVDDPSVPEETVAQVYQKGYKMGAKVLRAAMVTVTTGGPKREKKSADNE
jgi:molecular chaperone GrpE